MRAGYFCVSANDDSRDLCFALKGEQPVSHSLSIKILINPKALFFIVDHITLIIINDYIILSASK